MAEWADLTWVYDRRRFDLQREERELQDRYYALCDLYDAPVDRIWAEVVPPTTFDWLPPVRSGDIR